MSSVVQLRMDTTDKENFEFLLKNMGLDIDTAHRMFATKVYQHRLNPFRNKRKYKP